MRFMQQSLGGIARRSFLKVGAMSGFALGAYPVGAQTVAAEGALKAHQIPSAFVSVGADGAVTVTIGKIDIGQGVHTALPMLVAEEMDADWTKVRCEFAPAGEAYKDPIQQAQVVGGSTTMKNSWVQYREIGARMRAMLVGAASKRFGLPASQLKTDAGAVIAPDGRRASYGELAVAASAEPVPVSVQLKSPQQFNLIGKPTGRLDALDKSSGRQQFGIDLGLPGMRTVLILHPPVFGAKVERFDATRAKSIAGVEDVYQVPLVDGGTGLAIAADGFWPARKARELLQVEWDTRGLEKVDSDALLVRYRELAVQPGKKARTADTSALGAAPRGLDSTGDPVMNIPWSQAGMPGVCLPAGRNAAGLPLGLQVSARWWADEALLAWAVDLEAALRP